MIYADTAATAPLRKTALEAMLPWLTEQGYGNASSMYSIAREAKRAVEDARRTMADCLGAKPEEIFFTSGGTEGDNWAVKGSVSLNAGTIRPHIITTSVEHHAVLNSVAYLAAQGCEADYLQVDGEGNVSCETVEKLLKTNTVLVSIMSANNEIGTILPVNEIFAAVKAKNKKILCHTDAVQAVGHIRVSLNNVDLLTLAAHKFGGPKGVGALYVRKGVRLEPLLHGGGHERGKRSGTENVAGIIGMAAALKEAVENLDQSMKITAERRDRLISGVLSKVPYSHLNGPRPKDGKPAFSADRLPGNASFIFECVEGESLVLGLDAMGICASSGSACSSGSLDPSHVLMAIGLPQEVAHGNVRLSIDENITEVETDRIIESVAKVVAQRRAMSPLWNEKEQKPTERFWKTGA